MQSLNPRSRRAAIWRIIPMLLTGVLLSACSRTDPPQLQQGTLLLPAKEIAEFRLTDQNGESFTLDKLKGNWSFAFFGYTHCPDVCPNSLAMLAKMLRNLEKQLDPGQLPQVLFVSVDPQRDTPQVLSEFVPYFHPEFLGITGEESELLMLTRQLGILYGKADTEEATTNNYLVDHSAAIILFDPEARYHVLFNVPHDPDLMSADFLALHRYYETNR